MLYLHLTSLLCGQKGRKCIHVSSVHRQWYNEQETHLGQRAGSSGPPGMAVQEEGEQRLPGYQMEEVLVCAEEDISLLVHQPAGEFKKNLIH